jgi:N-acetylmuramic acid 6-phosphate etherase
MAENLTLLATESTSRYEDLDKQSVDTLLRQINAEDKTVPVAVEQVIPNIEALVNQIVPRMEQGGRLFYIGAVTSGRLGVVDASECPPTYGVPFDMVIGIIAGGDGAIRKAVENAEDDPNQAWKDMEAYDIGPLDTVIGIAASGRTPYVIGGLK